MAESLSESDQNDSSFEADRIAAAGPPPLPESAPDVQDTAPAPPPAEIAPPPAAAVDTLAESSCDTDASETSPALTSAPSLDPAPAPTPTKTRSAFLTWLMGTPDPSGQVRDLYELHPIKSTIKIAGPPTVSYLAGALMLFADQAVVGNFVGQEGLAAMGFAACFDALIKGVGALTGVGGNVLLSNALGAGSVELAEKTLGIAFFGTMLFSILFTAILLPLIGPILVVAQTPAEYLALARDYALPLVAGILPTVFCRALSGLLLAEGRSILSCAVNILLTVLNTVFGICLAIGGMGVLGTSLASIMASIIATIVLVVLYAGGHTTVRLRARHLLPRCKADWKILGTMVYVGLGDVLGTASSGVVSLILAAVSAIVMSNEAKYSPEEKVAGIAGVATLSNMFNLMNEIFTGLSSAGLIPLLSFADGRKDRKRFWAVMKANVILSTCVSFILYIVMVAAAPLVVRIFGTGEVYVHMASKMLRIGLCTLILVPPQFWSISAAQSLGMGTHAGILSIFCYLIFAPSFYALYGLFTGDIIIASVAFPTNDVLSFTMSCIILIAPMLGRTRYGRRATSHYDILAQIIPTKRVLERAKEEEEMGIEIEL